MDNMSNMDNMASKKRLSVGILGGTFDPPHWGHLRLAEHFSRVLQLDHIIWMPAGQPWQKGNDITSAKHRLAMSEYAIETLHDLFVDHHIYTKIDISTLEMSREGPSYAIDTAKELRALYGEQPSRILLPSALGGAILTLTADSMVRLVPGPGEVRLGIAMAVLGAPFFLLLLLRYRKGSL